MSAKFDKVLFLSLLSSVSLLLSVKQQASAAVILPESEAPPSSRLQPPSANTDPILSFAEPPPLDTGQSAAALALPPPVVPNPLVVEQPVALAEGSSSVLSTADLPVVVVPRVPPAALSDSSVETQPAPLPVPALPLPPVSAQSVLPPPPDVPTISSAVAAAPEPPPLPAPVNSVQALPGELAGVVAPNPLPPLSADTMVPPLSSLRPSASLATEQATNAGIQPPLSSLSSQPLPTAPAVEPLPSRTAVDDSIVLLAPPQSSLQANPLASAKIGSLPAAEPPALVAPDVNAPASVAAVNQPLQTAPAAGRDGKILTGVDVSGWQNEVDWQSLKDSGVDFAYLKSTEGRTFVDPTYDGNRQNARKVGVITGAYHFFRPATPALDQVDNFMKVVGRVESDDLPPALDLEDPSLWKGYSQTEKVQMVLTWLQEVEKRTGVRPIIYASPSFVESVLGSAPELASYKLWLAHYTSADAPSLPQPFSDWLMWQYSDKGRLPGVSGNVDLNRFRGHPQELLAQARVAPSYPQAPPLSAVAAVPQTLPEQGTVSPPVASVDKVADVIINFDLGAS